FPIFKTSLLVLATSQFLIAETPTSAPATLAAKTQPATSNQIAKAKMQMESIRVALEAFKIDFGLYPGTRENYPTTLKGLDALIPPFRREGRELGRVYGPYIAPAESVKDPWGNLYVYVAPAKPEGDFALSCAGPDGIAGTADDILVDSSKN